MLRLRRTLSAVVRVSWLAVLTPVAAAPATAAASTLSLTNNAEGHFVLTGTDGPDDITFSMSSPSQIEVTNNAPGGTITGDALSCAITGPTATCMFGGSAPWVVRTGAGDDRIDTSGLLVSSSPPFDIHTGEGDDDITGNGPQMTVLPGLGNDVLRSGGAPYMASYEDQTVPVYASLGSGSATMVLAGYTHTAHGSLRGVRGGSGNDTILGSADAEELRGGPGDDYIAGGGGDDVIHPGTGDDTAHDVGNQATLSYADTSAGVEVDLAMGTTTSAHGNDTFTGFKNVIGSAGDDTLTAGPGTGWMRGGPGRDTGDFSRYGSRIIIELNDPYAPGQELENVIGTPYDDTIHGTDGPNTILGGDGNDTISAHGGDDIVDGGPGHDLITMGAGGGQVDGGPGDDALVLADQPEPVHIDLLTGEGRVGDRDLPVTGIEHVTGGPGDDTLIGAAGSNTLIGLAGDDTLISPTGDGAPDTLDDGAGDDRFNVANNHGGDIVQCHGAGDTVDRDGGDLAFGACATIADRPAGWAGGIHLSGPALSTEHGALTYTFTADQLGPKTFHCRVGTGPWQPCTSPWTTPYPGDGEHRMQARVTDGQGDTETAETVTRVDAEGPTFTIAGAPPATLAEQITVTFTANKPVRTVECRIDDIAWTPCSSPLDWPLELGANTLHVRGVDLHGHQGPASVVTVVRRTRPAPPRRRSLSRNHNRSRIRVRGATARTTAPVSHVGARRTACCRSIVCRPPAGGAGSWRSRPRRCATRTCTCACPAAAGSWRRSRRTAAARSPARSPCRARRSASWCTPAARRSRRRSSSAGPCPTSPSTA